MASGSRCASRIESRSAPKRVERPMTQHNPPIVADACNGQAVTIRSGLSGLMVDCGGLTVD